MFLCEKNIRIILHSVYFVSFFLPFFFGVCLCVRARVSQNQIKLRENGFVQLTVFNVISISFLKKSFFNVLYLVYLISFEHEYE